VIGIFVDDTDIESLQQQHPGIERDFGFERQPDSAIELLKIARTRISIVF
jgi:hypothetical protein